MQIQRRNNEFKLTFRSFRLAFGKWEKDTHIRSESETIQSNHSNAATLEQYQFSLYQQYINET